METLSRAWPVAPMHTPSNNFLHGAVASAFAWAFWKMASLALPAEPTWLAATEPAQRRPSRDRTCPRYSAPCGPLPSSGGHWPSSKPEVLLILVAVRPGRTAVGQATIARAYT